jgi:hypothetical protein
VLDQYSILVACHSEPIYRELKSPYIEICSTTSGRRESGYEYYVQGIPGLKSRPESFSELSVLFNAKPFISDKKLVGFVHYRRIFSLNPGEKVEPVINIQFRHRFSRANLEASFLRLYEESIVIPIAWDQDRNLLLDFSFRHSILQDALEIACSEFDTQAAKNFGEINSKNMLAATNKIYPCNMWIGSEEFYREWASLILPVIKKIESDCLTLPTTGYQSRWAGFITERLFTVYINLCQQRLKWNLIERPMLMFVEDYEMQSNSLMNSMSQIFAQRFRDFFAKVRRKIHLTLRIS